MSGQEDLMSYFGRTFGFARDTWGGPEAADYLANLRPERQANTLVMNPTAAKWMLRIQERGIGWLRGYLRYRHRYELRGRHR